MKKIFTYLSEVSTELKKVTWPKQKEVVQLLSLVIAVTAVVSLYVGLVDFGLTKLLETLVTK